MSNFASTDYILAGSTSRSVTFALQTRVTIGNLKYSYSRKNEGATYDAAVAGTLSAHTALSDAFAAGKAFYLSATATDPGYFLLRVDFPDAAFNTGRDKVLCSVYDDATGVIAHRIFTLKGSDSIYVDGAVWVDTVNGSVGGNPYINGIPAKPCSAFGNAASIAAAVGLKRFRLLNRATAIDLATSSYAGYDFISDSLAQIDLGSVSRENVSFTGLDINDSVVTVTAGSGWTTFKDCRIGKAAGMDLPRAVIRDCIFTGIVHLNQNGNYFMAGLKTVDGGAVLDFKNSSAADPGITSVVISGFSGRLTVKNMLTTDSLEISGEGEVILDSTCNSATATVRVSGAIVVTNDATDISLTDATAGHIPTLKKNTAVANYTFIMIDATTGNPATGKTVAAQKSLNGGAFTPMVNTPATEISNGAYKIDIAAADVNGDTGAFRFTATGCEATIITFITES